MTVNKVEYIGWDDEVTAEEVTDFVTLANGDYLMRVTKFERGETDESMKKYPCAPRVTITLVAEFPNGAKAVIKDDFLFVKPLKWKMDNLFTCAGMIEAGEKYSPADLFQKLPGSELKVKVVVNNYTNRTTQQQEVNNRIKTYYSNPDKEVSEPVEYTPTSRPAPIPKQTTQTAKTSTQTQSNPNTTNGTNRLNEVPEDDIPF